MDNAIEILKPTEYSIIRAHWGITVEEIWNNYLKKEECNNQKLMELTYAVK